EVGAAGAGAGRVAALSHEALDHPVEGRVVVEALPRERLHPLDMVRREVGPELDHHLAGGKLHDQRVLGIELGRRGGERQGKEDRQGGGKELRDHSFSPKSQMTGWMDWPRTWR